MNIKPKYERGMELESADYHIEISHPGIKRIQKMKGYQTWVRDIEVDAGEPNEIQAILKKHVTAESKIVRSKPTVPETLKFAF
jgi:hypothetical protein